MANVTKMNSPQSFARTLVRILSKERDKGEFYLSGKVGGYNCRLDRDAYGFVLLVWGFKYKDKAFRRRDNIYVMIRANEPEPRHGKVEEIKGVRKILGIRAFRVLNSGAIQRSSILAFCIRHKNRIKQLQLKENEDIGIFDDCIRFRWDGVDLDVLERRFESFANLIREISGSPPAERQLFQTEWLLKKTPKSKTKDLSAAHQFGGKVVQPIGCADCNEATNLVVQLDLSDPLLPRTVFGRKTLSFFWCLSCCEWGPNYYDISGPHPTPLGKTGKALKSRKLPENEEDLDPRAMMLFPVAGRKKAGRRSKVGGKPVWLQPPSNPCCPRCDDQMAFVLQFASDADIAFDDMGILYGFACPRCKVVASLIQSY
jgi:hypothetical protein